MTPNKTDPVASFPVPLPVSIIPPATEARRSLKDNLEVAGKLLLGTAGLCYVTGLMVVSLHLSRYGLNSLTLSQLHYVMAGIWALLPVVLAIFLATAATNSAFETIEQIGEPQDSNAGKLAKLFSKRNRKIASSVFGTLLVMSFGLWMLLGYLGIKFGWSWLVVVPAGVIVAFFLFGAGYGLSTSKAYPDFKSLILMMTAAMVGILFFLGYLILFTRFAYQDIPWSTGGGGPSQVELVVATDEKAQLESVGIKFSAGENRTSSLKLLLATEKEYVVINPAGKAVSIPADSVKLIVYEK